MAQRVSTSRNFGVKPARIVLSLQAIHSIQSENDNVHCVKINYTALQIVTEWLIKKRIDYKVIDQSKKRYRDPLRAYIIFNTSYEKFDLSSYALVPDNTLLSPRFKFDHT